MVIRITWGKLRAGAWDEFERTYRANVITKHDQQYRDAYVAYMRSRGHTG